MQVQRQQLWERHCSGGAGEASVQGGMCVGQSGHQRCLCSLVLPTLSTKPHLQHLWMGTKQRCIHFTCTCPAFMSTTRRTITIAQMSRLLYPRLLVKLCKKICIHNYKYVLFLCIKWYVYNQIFHSDAIFRFFLKNNFDNKPDLYVYIIKLHFIEQNSYHVS